MIMKRTSGEVLKALTDKEASAKQYSSVVEVAVVLLSVFVHEGGVNVLVVGGSPQSRPRVQQPNSCWEQVVSKSTCRHAAK